MAYKLVKDRRAWWPVKWNGVTEEGRVVENSIELRFILHTEDAFIKLLGEASELPEKAKKHIAVNVTAEEESTALSVFYTGFLQKIASDWRGVQGENGEPLRWEADNIQLLMNEASVFTAAVAAYQACRSGIKDIRSGN